LKWGQKLCPIFIKKKRIAQLINGKLGKNRYNNTPNVNKTTNKPSQPTTTTTQPQLMTHRTPHHKEDQLNEPTTRNGSIKQAAAELSK
jgi:hypothetical protein